MLVTITPIKNDEVEVKAIERTEQGDKELTDKEFADLLFQRKGYFDSQISYNEKDNLIKIVILNF